MLDGQRLAVDFAFDHGVALQLDAIAADNAFADAENDRLLRDDIPFDLRPFLDNQMRSVDVTVDAAANLQSAFADDIAGNKYAVTKS